MPLLEQTPPLLKLHPKWELLLEFLPPPRLLMVLQPLALQEREQVLVLLASGLNQFFRQSWGRPVTRVRGSRRPWAPQEQRRLQPTWGLLPRGQQKHLLRVQLPQQPPPQVLLEQPVRRQEQPGLLVLEQQELRPQEPRVRAPPLALFRQVLWAPPERQQPVSQPTDWPSPPASAR